MESSNYVRIIDEKISVGTLKGAICVESTDDDLKIVIRTVDRFYVVNAKELQAAVKNAIRASRV